jgi:cell wall-associated NlpC family hydrolase
VHAAILPALAAKLALALGFDTVLQWVLRLLVALVVVGLIVTLIVIQTLAGILAGGRSGSDAASNPPAVARTPALPAPIAEPPSDGDLGGRVEQIAQLWLGVPYVFGGCSHSRVDCSCLVQNVYAALGIRLPRVAVDQFNAKVPIGDPQPGHLVFFANTYQSGISQVGTYIGNGLQINAPTTDQVVSGACVVSGYWGAHYAGARRVRS